MEETGFAEALVKLNSQGIRLTTQRKWILRYIKGTLSHPTAEEVYLQVSKDLCGITRPTVYTALNSLCELGIIRKYTFGNGSSRYDGNALDHAHFVCQGCGGMFDVESPLPAFRLPHPHEFVVHSVRLEIYGLCPECQIQLKSNS